MDEVRTTRENTPGVSYILVVSHRAFAEYDNTFGVQRVLESILLPPSSFWSTPETDMAEVCMRTLSVALRRGVVM